MPPRKVIYSRKAQADMRQNVGYLLLQYDLITAQQIVTEIYQEISGLADQHLLGNQIKGKTSEYRHWLIRNKQYKVYFRRTDSIFRVLRVRPSRSKPIGVDEIE
jgi:plasmid stabilization system protein ParE